MQQMSTEEEEEIEYAICIESGAIQPKTVGKEREEKKNSRIATRVGKRQWRIVSF